MKIMDEEAKEILNRHLKIKNITNEHIHVAAYISCINAIKEALEKSKCKK